MDFFKSKKNIKLPDDFQDPDKMRNYLKEFIKIKALAKVGWKLGLGNPIDLFNKVAGYYFPDEDLAAQKGDDNVDVTYTDYEGVPVKLYIPKQVTSGQQQVEGQGVRGMVFYHGGGYCLGSADEMDGLTRRLAVDCSMVIASVNYRLAPDHVYPAAVDDCMKATKHFLSNCSQLYNVDSSRVIIAGDSSGGHLAASIASRLSRQKFSPRPRCQVLIYPVLQTMNFMTPSYLTNQDDPYLCRWLMVTFMLTYVMGRGLTKSHVASAARNQHVTSANLQRYLELAGSESTDTIKPDQVLCNLCDVMNHVDFNPLLEEDFSILPDTYIIKCKQDVLTSEIDLYADKLKQTGQMEVKVNEYCALHAMLDYLDLPVAEKAISDLVTYINTL